MPRAIGIIPARYGSTRLPGKPLVLIHGKPLIYWVWKQVKSAKSLSRVIVATDDLRIKRAVEDFGGEAVLTSPRHPSGTDRVAEAALKLNYGIIVNIQGDEPLIPPGAIDQLVSALVKDKTVDMATLATPISDRALLSDPHAVKVVLDKNRRALYFSRFLRPLDFGNLQNGQMKQVGASYFFHVGIYAYRKKFLLKLVNLKPSRLEKLERLEQLRVLENGYPIKVVVVKAKTQSVDTPRDVNRMNKLFRRKK